MPESVNVAFVNLPHKPPIVRRYMCSYHSPLFRIPPYDLLQLAACAKEWGGAEVSFLDAIAENCDEAGVHAFLALRRPDIVVAIVGIESVSADLACMDRIKDAFPHMTTAVFGYYATVFSELILEKTSVDLVLRNEPEETFSAYLAARSKGVEISGIPGLAGRDAAGAVFANPEQRITDIDNLPFADYSLIDVKKYEEALLGGPCGAILSARGCPFTCTYCTRTFGQRLVAKKPETVVAEIKSLMRAGIRVIRFVDDTFTFNKARVIEICQGILREHLSITWACLARADTLDTEMLHWMKKAGCARVLVGIESYSPKVLDYLGKRTDPAKTNAALQLVHDAGIEVFGMLLVGAPEETEADFQETLNGVMHSPLDLILVFIITPYAGTPFFDRVKEDIVFNLIPYECRFKAPRIGVDAVNRARRLYWSFYLRPTVWLRQFRRIIRFPYRSARLFLMVLWFGLVGRKTEERADIF